MILIFVIVLVIIFLVIRYLLKKQRAKENESNAQNFQPIYTYSQASGQQLNTQPQPQIINNKRILNP